MTQEDILEAVTARPGILQKELVSQTNRTNDCMQILALKRKGLIRRELSGRTYALYPVVEE